MAKTIRPKYYQDKQGHDLFWRMEHNHFPAALSMGFCILNIRKYQDRAGVKTPDANEDLQKAETYQQELDKLTALYHRGKITNQGLEHYLHNTHWERQMIAMGTEQQQAHNNIIPYPPQLMQDCLGPFFIQAFPDLFFTPSAADDQLNVIAENKAVATIYFDAYGHYNRLITTQARYQLDNQAYAELVSLKETLDQCREAYDQLQQIASLRG